MYRDAVEAVARIGVEKLDHQRRSLLGHLVRSALAGMYVGVAIVLILVVGGNLSTTSPHLVKLLMGVCFGGALTIVLFAGSELFTGCNLVLPLAVVNRRASLGDLATNWGWTWLGNLMGSGLLVLLVVRSGVLDTDPVRAFVLKVGHVKASLPAEQMVIRGVLANWIVCLAVLDEREDEERVGPHRNDLVVHVHVHHLLVRAQCGEYDRAAAGDPAVARRIWRELVRIRAEPVAGHAGQHPGRDGSGRHPLLARQPG